MRKHLLTSKILIIVNLANLIMILASCNPMQNINACKGDSRKAIATHSASDLPRSAKAKKAHYTYKKKQTVIGSWFDGLFMQEGWHSAK